MNPTEQKINERIHEFDIYALLQLLQHLGYQAEEIFFKSSLPPLSPASLFDNIEFRATPVRQVVITINLGLFGALSPLPSYFMKLVENAGTEESSLLDFLFFFDHQLIQHYLNSIYPERDPALYPNWEHTKRAYLGLLAFNSSNFLHRIFQLVFPELGITVQKSQHHQQLRAGGIYLGQTVLGASKVLGAKASVPVPGFDVTLYCDEEPGVRKTSWADKVARRLHELIFPVLQEADIAIKLILVIRSQKGWLQLQQGSALGVDKVYSQTEQNRRVVLFHGKVTAANLEGSYGQTGMSH